MNSTGEFDENNFHQNMESKQENLVAPIIKYMFEQIQVSKYGFIDEDITFEFNPLGVVDEETESKLKTEALDRIMEIASLGIYSNEQIKNMLETDGRLNIEVSSND